MNKKIILTIIVLSAVIALMPLIGNRSISTVIDNRLAILEDNGLHIEKESQSTYMQSSAKYTISVDDAKKFMTYLNTLSQSQVPPYVEALVDDTVVGVDLSYSNIPLLSDVSVDIYPVALSKEIDADILADDPIFHEQLRKILDEQMLVYHIDYAVSSMSFKGYIKDINQKLDFKDGSKVELILQGSKFKGKGTIMEPSQIESSIKKIEIHATDATDAMVDVKIDNMSTANIFDAKNAYKLGLIIDALDIKLKQGVRKASLDFEALSLSYMMKTDDKYMNLGSTMKLKEIALENEGEKFSAQNVDYDIGLNKLDKEDAQNIEALSYKLQSTPAAQATMLMSEAILKLMEKGFDFNINNFSVDAFSLAGQQPLKGFDLDLHTVFKPDPQLKQKMSNPMALMNNIDLSSKLSFQKELYEFLQAQSPQGAMSDNFAKKDGDNIIFDIILKDQKLSVNGQKL